MGHICYLPVLNTLPHPVSVLDTASRNGFQHSAQRLAPFRFTQMLVGRMEAARTGRCVNGNRRCSCQTRTPWRGCRLRL